MKPDLIAELRELIRSPLSGWDVAPTVIEYEDNEFTVHFDFWNDHYLLNVWHDGDGFCVGDGDYPLNSKGEEREWVWQAMLYTCRIERQRLERLLPKEVASCH